MKRKFFLPVGMFVLLTVCAVTGMPVLKARADGPGSWSVTGSMLIARSGHTATRLSNGKVLVAGGYDGSHDLASAELYDPATGSWTVMGSMSTGRGGHTATLLPNGKVLVAGGYNDQSGYLTSAELYDPDSGSWSTTGSMAEARTGHTATLLPNGKVLVAGGMHSRFAGDIIASAELYDPATGTWSVTGSMNWVRVNFTATLLTNGKVLAVGGYIGYGPHWGGDISSAELYDPATGSWLLTGSIANGRGNHTATLLTSGKVLVVGGYRFYGNYRSSTLIPLATVEIYDPVTGVWSSASALSTPRADHKATLLPNRKVLVAGGLSNDGRLASTEMYDSTSGSWSAASSLPVALSGATATLLSNGKVLMTGGNDSTGHLSTSAELFSYPDTAAPVVYVPGTITVNATSLQGAVVNYTVKVSDPDTDESFVTVSCTPPSGSLFPSKTTVVQCRASDPAGNTGKASFRVVVYGEAHQVGDLIQLVDSFRLRAAIQQSLDQKLKQARDVLNQENEGPACRYMSAFSQQVSALSGTSIPTDQADRLSRGAASIRTVLGCDASASTRQ